jgi:signal transduction histidine kinase
LQRLIEDLLEYSRVNTRGKEFVSLDTNAVVQEAIANLSSAITETHAEVVVHDLPPVVGDRSQLVRVFQNLLSNAIKFHGDQPPRISVAGRRTDTEVLLTVRDNGIGIPPEHRERIFVIFQRLHTRTAYPGTGMGLAICKHIIERHGGWISVQEADGGGSLFSISLPAEQPPPENHRPNEQPPAAESPVAPTT